MNSSFYYTAEREGCTKLVATLESMPDRPSGRIHTERGAIREARKAAKTQNCKQLVASWNDCMDRYAPVAWVWPDGDVCSP